MNIHPSAVVDAAAELADDVVVGPLTVIEAGVKVGAGSKIGPGCYLATGSTLGERNLLTASVTVGTPPQDLSYQGCESQIVIGDDNVFREFVSLHRGTPKEDNLTRIGDHNFIMVGSHVGHDCVLGSHITLTNCVHIAGHCHLGDRVVMAGYAGLAQFTSVGRMAYIGAKSRVVQDVPPFVKISGDPAEVRMVNEVGMQRGGIPREEIDEVKHVYRAIFRTGRSVSEEAHALINDGSAMVRELAEFLLRKEAGRFGRYRESLRGH
ncbi:MAG: acyl-[acyl-carrier-protein]--UDP-N-acetylglucosamine O-acyltransferase [Planctomycetota bacterium]|nr:MAG: acyl-[acyl-carrier-protein]--UDP-N-acetylglucosamine O-acyltransferase [Planctomycetota bacterium]